MGPPLRSSPWHPPAPRRGSLAAPVVRRSRRRARPRKVVPADDLHSRGNRASGLSGPASRASSRRAPRGRAATAPVQAVLALGPVRSILARRKGHPLR